MAEGYRRRDAGVQERVVITGQLVLTRPTSLSNGDAEGLTDIAIRRDEATGRPLLPGTSLAGALRGYLAERLGDDARIGHLFGNVVENTSRQSWLFVEDALGMERGLELRDGVALDAATRTAADRLKFDRELLAAGTTFDLWLEFWLPTAERARAMRTQRERVLKFDLRPEDLRALLAQALEGLTRGEIRLGGRKRRGFGECCVKDWQVYRYDMGQVDGLLGWLENDSRQPAQGTTLAQKLGVAELPALADPDTCHLTATFALDGSLLHRAALLNSEGRPDPAGPDMAHLRNHAGEPVLAGTSVAGALRARARRIARLLMSDADAADAINGLFGQEMRQEAGSPPPAPRASRLWVRETVLKGGVHDRVQSRVKIDRFTGGTYPGALFDQQAAWGGEVTLDLSVRKATSADVGLLLLLLKDLWTGDLPLGGEASVGRGRLRGKGAALRWNGQQWTIEDLEQTGRLTIIGERQSLEDAVRALREGGMPPVEEAA